MLSAALVTKLMGVPTHKVTDAQKQKRIHRLITVITVIAVVPSVLIGGYKVYQTVMEQNVTDYLDHEFVFSDTQVVQSEMDIFNREISVSLVGAQVSDEVIARLEQELPQYGLEGYSLHITQNKSAENTDSEKVTIAVQEQTIQELQTKLEEQQTQLDKMDDALSSQIDCKKLAEDSRRIFTKLSDCSCGIMSDSNGEYILLTAAVKEPLSEEEEQTIKNWMLTESELSRAELYIYLP